MFGTYNFIQQKFSTVSGYRTVGTYLVTDTAKENYVESE